MNYDGPTLQRLIERDIIDVNSIDSVVKAESISVAPKTAATADKTIDDQGDQINLKCNSLFFTKSVDFHPRV